MTDTLLEAIEAHDVDRLADLLAAGADPNAIVTSRYYTLEWRVTPLHAAVGELEAPSEKVPGAPIEAVVLLLRHGAVADRRDPSMTRTPLLTAVTATHIEAVRLLLAHGADPNVRDDEGESPLRFCAENGLLEMARLLLHCGATKTIHEGGGPAGMNALGYAATRLHVDMVRLLLAHGADPLIGDADDITVFRRLGYACLPEDPAAQERLREIRALLGDPPA